MHTQSETRNRGGRTRNTRLRDACCGEPGFLSRLGDQSRGDGVEPDVTPDSQASVLDESFQGGVVRGDPRPHLVQRAAGLTRGDGDATPIAEEPSE